MSETLGIYVVTEDEERIDRVARSIYGEEGNRAVELLLEANPGLVGQSTGTPGVLPFGTVLLVPAQPARSSEALVRPWQ